MHDGARVASWQPAEIITANLIEFVFGIRTIVVPDPVTAKPFIVPCDPRESRVDRDPIS